MYLVCIEFFLLERQNPLQFVAEFFVLGLLEKSRGESIAEALVDLLLEIAVRDEDERTWAG